MADKRATPEAPEGSRRRKREAPTIDLKATEIPPPQEPAAEAAAESPPETSDPPPPPPPQSETSEAPPPPPQPDAEQPPRATNYGVAIAAGLAGAIITSAILAALWYDGLLPPRAVDSGQSNAQVTALQKQVESLRHDVHSRSTSAVDAKAIDALTQRVGRIETDLAKLPPGDQSVAQRLSAAENAMKSLGVALAALGRRDDTISADAKQARESADAAQKAMSDLRTGIQDAAKPSGVAPEALDALRQRVTVLEQSVKDAREQIAKAAQSSAATSRAARLALSAAALRSAVESGAPYAQALAQAKALGVDPAKLAALSPFAQGGIPSAASLARELDDLLPALRKSSGADRGTSGGFLERLQANASRLVRIRPVNAPSGNTPSDLLARVEADVAKGDIDGALADLAKLPEAGRKPAEGWIAKARQRQAALAAARDLARVSALALEKS